MKRLLIVVDAQNDFIDGVLGTNEAVAMVPNLVKKIKEWDGDILCIRDTHFDNYMETNEAKFLPIEHCFDGTDGHKINSDVMAALTDFKNYTIMNKFTLASMTLPKNILEFDYDYIELVGLRTDVCVISNALLLKAYYPEINISVDASCCAGTTPENHTAAITILKKCQVNVIE